MKISTGIPIFNTPVDPQGTENQSSNVIFSTASTSLISHIIDASECALVIKAYGLADGNTITVYTVSDDGLGNLTGPLIINGRTVQLAESNNTLVLDISGRYKFVLSGGLGVVSCVYHESGMSMFSFGLAAFATLDATLQFVETETVLPAVAGVEVRENVKLSASSGNLLQIHSDGLYYGIQPPPNFANQYVSSSLGSDDPNTNDGTQANPWKTIQYAVNNLPDGTIGFIYLYAGDTFTTWVDGSGNPPVGDVITGYTYVQALQAVSDQRLATGNKQIYFVPYNDVTIDDIIAYNNAHGTGYNPYVVREIDFPIIKFPIFQLSDALTTYLPASITIGPAGALNFNAITFEVGQSGTVGPGYVNGCFPGNGGLSLIGGNIVLGSVPFLGNAQGAGSQTFREDHLQVKNAAVPSNPTLFNVSGTQLLTNTTASYAYSGTPYFPGLTYTDNADNTETLLAAVSYWANLIIYSTAFRSYSRVTTDIAIA